MKGLYFMSIRKVKDSTINLELAINNLIECTSIIQIDSIIVDATIHRFEIVIRLVWKTLRRALKYEGYIVDTPRESLKLANSINWIENEFVWLDILYVNDCIIHAYTDDKISFDLFHKIAEFTPEIKRLNDLFKMKYCNEKFQFVS